MAGAAVAALAVPQGMAYALVAGLPPEMGLLAAAIPALIAAVFGSHSHLVTGPTLPIALLVGSSVVAPVVASGGAVPVGAVLETGLLAGAFLLAFGALDLGRASRFVSDSVIAGFATGAGLRIALGQIPASFGASVVPVEVSRLAPEVWPAVRGAAEAALHLDPRATALALAVPVIGLIIRRVDRRIPGALLALLGATLVAHLLGWAEGSDAIDRVGDIPARLPTLALPPLSDPLRLGVPALAVALLATVQSIAAARSLPTPTGQRFEPNRELLSQGLANVAAAAGGALPVCGSLTRSALARAAGGRSRLAPAASGLTVALVVPLIAPLVSRIPLPALAGLVVFAGLDPVNPVALRRASATRGDALVLCATLVATLWIDLVQAVYVGLLLALALLVRRAGRLRISELVRAGSDRLREIPVDERTGRTPVAVLNLEGDLSFAVAPDLTERLLEIGARGARVIVLRIKRAHYLDATVLEALRRVLGQVGSRGTRILLCGLTDDKVSLIRRTGLGRSLGEEGLIQSGARLAEGLERALRRAEEIAGPGRQEELFRTEEDSGWIYEI
jgi:SulP family sulfate permease